jgi:REP element-mobilizing transposase RayT
MPRRRTQFAQGQYYHIYNRGVERRPIFREEENYLYLLRLVKEYTGELGVTVIAYCLMPNHYHVLVRQDGEKRAGLLPQLAFNRYTKAFNKRYGRTGTLFEGRYRSVWVDRTEYLFHLCRYIHANPVKAGLVSRLEEWPFSNYLEWVRKRNGTLVDREFVAESFPDVDGYCEFVLEYLEASDTLPQGIEPYLLDAR